MCIIVACENRCLTKEEFDCCFDGNHHGVGFGWRIGSTNYYKKGFMKLDVAWEVYQTVPLPHIAHFRLASAGGVCPELTHPFVVSAESPIAMEWQGPEKLLFHNGTITDWKTMLFSIAAMIGHLPEGEMSDTRFVALAYHYMGQDVFRFFSSKFAILKEDGINTIGNWRKIEDGLTATAEIRRTSYVCSSGNYNSRRDAYGYYGYDMDGYGAAADDDETYDLFGIKDGDKVEVLTEEQLNDRIDERFTDKSCKTCKEYREYQRYDSNEHKFIRWGKCSYRGPLSEDQKKGCAMWELKRKVRNKLKAQFKREMINAVKCPHNFTLNVGSKTKIKDGKITLVEERRAL